MQKMKMTNERLCVYFLYMCVFSHHALEVYVSLILWRDLTSRFLKPFMKRKHIKMRTGR